MNKSELIQKITEKKEFSQLPKKDIELAFSHFEKRQVSDEEKIRLIRELLHKVFGAFTSQKLLSPKNKNEEWVLRKHLSTRERLPYYFEIYKKILAEYKNKKISIIDLGAGVNGFSYRYLLENRFAPPTSASLSHLRPDERNHSVTQNKKFKVNYLGIEAVGQLVNLMNNYFARQKVKPLAISSKLSQNEEKLNARLSQARSASSRLGQSKAIHESLFELEKIKKIILKTEKPKIIFLFKVLDSLEMLKGDYSKKLLKKIVSLADKVIVSFATASMVKRKKFKVNRSWILNFIKENFEILDDFEIGGEKYISFRAK